MTLKPYYLCWSLYYIAIPLIIIFEKETAVLFVWNLWAKKKNEETETETGERERERER